MKRFVCKNCNYSFESVSGNARICPYCGKETIREQLNAEELLEDS